MSPRRLFSTRQRLGATVAAVLAGAWRPASQRLLPDETLGRVVTLLLDSGLSGIVSAGLSPTLRSTRTGREHCSAARADATAAARLDSAIPSTIRALTAVGADPIVTKGWAVARYYSASGMRPYADLDLCVRPDRGEAAQGALRGMGEAAAVVDLHVGLPDLPQRSWTEVFARTRTIDMAGVGVRVLAPEDQFRLLAVHMVRHVCHRPLWLVDLAVLLESAGREMDWDLCLRGSHSWRRWLLAVAGLAARLLGARLPAAIAELPGTYPPDWLVDLTLWRWGGGGTLAGRELLTRPSEWWPYVANKVLNPVRWAYRMGLPPIRFVPAIWVASVLGRGVQPYPRIWRALLKRRRLSDVFPVHERRVF